MSDTKKRMKEAIKRGAINSAIAIAFLYLAIFLEQETGIAFTKIIGDFLK